MGAALWLLALTGCTGAKPGDSGPSDSGPVDGTGDSAAPGEGMEVVAQSIEAGALLSMWVDGDELLFVGGEISDSGPGYYVRYDGEGFCYEADVADRAFWWAHGAEAGAWYAVGERGLILRDEGGVRTDESVPTEATLYGVFDEGDRTWAVGGDAAAGTGEIWKKEGGTWELFHSGDGPFFKVWCDGEGSCLFNGSYVSMAVQGDASSAYTPDPAPDAHLLTCSGRSFSDIWCVGGLSGPQVWRWDGSTWSEASTAGLAAPLLGVWTAEGEDVYVSGASGITARWDGEVWSSDIPVVLETFHAVIGFGGELWYAGGNLTTTSGDYYGTIGHYGQPLGLQDVPACGG